MCADIKEFWGLLSTSVEEAHFLRKKRKAEGREAGIDPEEVKSNEKELQAVVDEIRRTNFQLDTLKSKVANCESIIGDAERDRAYREHVSIRLENDRLAIEGFERQVARLTTA